MSATATPQEIKEARQEIRRMDLLESALLKIEWQKNRLGPFKARRLRKFGAVSPRIGAESQTLKARKPWIAEGMSERTWYRRRKERS